MSTIQQAWNDLQATPSYVERFQQHATVGTDEQPAAHLCWECQTWGEPEVVQDADDGERNWEAEAQEAARISDVDQAYYQCDEDDGPEFVPDELDQEELDELFAPDIRDVMDPWDIWR